MGVVKTTRSLPYLVKKRWQEKYCSHCEDYINRRENSEKLEELLGWESGVWDFQTCYTTCWQDMRTRQAHNSLAYYHRKVGIR